MYCEYKLCVLTMTTLNMSHMSDSLIEDYQLNLLITYSRPKIIRNCSPSVETDKVRKYRQPGIA